MRQNFCIKSISDCNEINRSQLNDSISKNLWTFPKSPRFQVSKSYCDSIYNIPDFIQPKKGVALGYGTKYDFTEDKTSSPPATKYQLSSSFSQNITKKKGFSIAIGRELSKRNGHIELQPLEHPGPGSYFSKIQQSNGINYSMRKKTKVLDRVNSLQSQNNNPGPGRYENPEAISKNGKYYLTKFKDSQATIFPKQSNRLANFDNSNPGPGNYIKNQNDLSKRGKYLLSKHRGLGTRPFDHEVRKTFVDVFTKLHQSPGPGSYRAPSDFGQYDIKKEMQKKQ